jgi:hypothetical protein
LIFFLIFSLETPKAGSGLTKWRTVLSLASLSAILFPHTPECPGIQNNPTECWMEMSFIAFWHCCTNGNVVLMAWRALKAAWLSEQILPYVSDLAVLISLSFCSSPSDGWSGSYWMFWFNPSVVVPNAPMITGTIFVLTAHILLTLICRSLYLFSFSVYFVLMFESSGMAVSVSRLVFSVLSCSTVLGQFASIVQSVITGTSNVIVVLLIFITIFRCMSMFTLLISHL